MLLLRAVAASILYLHLLPIKSLFGCRERIHTISRRFLFARRYDSVCVCVRARQRFSQTLRIYTLARMFHIVLILLFIWLIFFAELASFFDTLTCVWVCFRSTNACRTRDCILFLDSIQFKFQWWNSKFTKESEKERDRKTHQRLDRFVCMVRALKSFM